MLMLCLTLTKMTPSLVTASWLTKPETQARTCVGRRVEDLLRKPVVVIFWEEEKQEWEETGPASS